MDDNSYNNSDSNEMDGISVVLMGVSCRRNEAEKSNGWTGSSIMRNWKAGMMQRRWRDSEDQLTRV